MQKGDASCGNRYQNIIAFSILMILLSIPGMFLVENQSFDFDKKKFVPQNTNTYELFLAVPNDSGGDGSITTIEPDGIQKEADILSGVEFRTVDLLSDLTVYGQGSATEIHLYIYLLFRGSEQSTADLTFTLNAVGGPTYIETISLDNPCQDEIFNDGCLWSLNEISFDVPEDGFTIEKGAQLRLQIDGSASCEGQTGQGKDGADECEVLVAYNDLETTNSFSRISLKANPLEESSMKVHAHGSTWTDAENLEWFPNHRPEFRTIQFSVDVRNAFGYEDINSVKLIVTHTYESNVVLEENLEEYLEPGNDGLIVIWNWTYDAGIAAGHCNLSLVITDSQGEGQIRHNSGFEFLDYGIRLSQASGQNNPMLIAPGEQSSVGFLVEHTGSAGTQMHVELELYTSFPSSWSGPIWDQPAGYSLPGGGSFIIATLSVEAPNGDLSDVPDRIEVWARGFVENSNGIVEEVVIEKLILDVEEVGVYSPPRLNVYEDEARQIQIADSIRPDAFDNTHPNYVDSSSSSSGEAFYIDLFNAGFHSDMYRLKVDEAPSSSWTYAFFDNDTGSELTTEGPYAVTPSISSHEIMPLMLKIYPPINRADVDIGMFTIICYSTGDDQFSSTVSFTVHRTFGILAQVISDSDGQEIGSVGPVDPGSEISFGVRITDFTGLDNQKNWNIISPGNYEKNINAGTGNPSYGTWDYSITDDNGAGGQEDKTVQLSSGETVDVEVTIKMTDQVLAGDHTLYLLIAEDTSEDDPRYFELPLEIKVREQIISGRIFVERVTELTPFLPSADQTYEFRIQNSNNVVFDVIISVQELPDGWSAGFTTSGTSEQRSTILLELYPYSTSEFSLVLIPPSDFTSQEDVSVVLSIEPIFYEFTNTQLKQTAEFMFPLFCETCEGGFSDIFDENKENNSENSKDNAESNDSDTVLISVLIVSLIVVTMLLVAMFTILVIKQKDSIASNEHYGFDGNTPSNDSVEEWVDSSGVRWRTMSDGNKYWWNGIEWTQYE